MMETALIGNFVFISEQEAYDAMGLRDFSNRSL
jgi:hypothetical protein